MNVYSKEQLQGILLSCAVPEAVVFKNSKKLVGYEIRIGVIIRGQESFLKGVQRSLLQQQISARYYSKETKARQRPVLRISGRADIEKIESLVPSLPDAKDKWDKFRAILDVWYDKRHLVQGGLDEILRIKGEI